MSELKEEGVFFAILRGGYTGKDKVCYKDSEFETHYNNAFINGIHTGVYHYSRATSYEEGKKEALFLYENCLKNKKFEYPIYIDVEDSLYQKGAGKNNVTEAIKGFCESLENLGYYAGVYCNLNWANNYMNYDELKLKYDFWLAAWSTNPPNDLNYKYGMWQFGGETNELRSNELAGYICDQNYAYKEYPEIMKENSLNGFVKEVIEEPIIEEPIIEENNEIEDWDIGNFKGPFSWIKIINKFIIKIIKCIIGKFIKKD